MATTTHGNLTVTASGDDGQRRLELRGRLDESVVGLVAHAPAWHAATVVLDSGGVEAINSIGIREWMHLVAALTAGGARVIHERCAEVLVEQMCFIPAVRGGGQVRSFHAPYHCDGCDREASVLIDVETHQAALVAMTAPPATCATCGQPMALADVPERSFAFLADR